MRVSIDERIVDLECDSGHTTALIRGLTRGILTT
jgi:hypothetical protein